MDGRTLARRNACTILWVIIVGSEALASGDLTRSQLRNRYRRVLPDVYAPRRAALTLSDRVHAAVLWSGRRAVVSGVAASALHGAEWISADATIELNHSNNRAPAGIRTRDETLLDDEVTLVRGVEVTTVERTALDLARRGPVVHAVQRLDALARAQPFKIDDVLAVAGRHPGLRGSARVAAVLDLVDAGAQSPQETWLRLVFLAGSYGRPDTQVPVPGPDGLPVYFLDLGWQDHMIAAEYDGEFHRLDRGVYRNDITRSEYIEHRGWRRMRVIAGDRVKDIYRRAEALGLRPTHTPPAILTARTGVWR